jgi:chromosome segregation ATPase
MEAYINSIEKSLSTSDLAYSEQLKDFVLSSVKSQLEDWLNNTLTISCISEEIERRYKINKSDIYESNREIKRLERELESCRDQNKQNFTELCKMRLFLDDILTDLRLKAYQGDLEKVSRSLEDKCSWDFAQDILNKTRSFATTSTLESLQTVHEQFKEKVSKEFELKKDSASSLERLEKKIMSLMTGFISRDELRSNSSNFTIRISGVQEEFLALKKEAKMMEENLKKEVLKIRNDYSDVIRQFQFDRLKKELDGKTSKVDFDGFIQENLPKITEYSQELKRVNRFIEDQEKAITRIDEIICDKASKLDLKKLKDSFYEFPAKLMEAEIKKLKDSCSSLAIKTKEISEDMKEMFQSLEESGSNKINYDTRLNLIKTELRDIENRLSCKAEISDVLEYLERKASWEDYAHLAESIETVHVQTKLLAAQLMSVKPTSSKKASSQKKITKKLVDIVVSSRPATDESPSTQLKHFIKFPPTPDILRSRACTPNKRFTNFCNSLQT